MQPPLTQVANYARRLHRGQRRDDGAPFFLHPLEAARLLEGTGHRRAVVAAALLHDTVENSQVQIDDLANRFGDEVAELVAAVTEDPQIDSFGERKSALRRQVAGSGPDAAAIFAADKVSKVRELRGLARSTHGRHPKLRRKRIGHYRSSLEMLERRDPSHPLVRELRHELGELEAAL